MPRALWSILAILILCGLLVLQSAAAGPGAGVAAATPQRPIPGVAADVPQAAVASIVIDHTCTDVTKIPNDWLSQAKNLAIHYAHTSHGSQLISGIDKLYQLDSRYRFALVEADNPPSPRPGGAGVLGIYDGNPPDTYITPELYWAETDGINRTRSVAGTGLYPFSMWAWCGQQSDNSIETVQQYLNTLNQFETEYPGMRFILMTGHTDGGGVAGTLYRNNNLVRNYAAANGKILFDFADIESYDPAGNYYPNTDDSCPWCDDWCSAHPSDCVNLPDDCAHSHPLNCKLKGNAFWWLMARVAGWNGQPAEVTPTATATRTPSPTHTMTPSRTPTPTEGPSPTPTATASATPTRTATPTFTVGPSPTATSTKTPKPTASITPTPTATATGGPVCGQVIQRGTFGTVADAYIWAASPDYTGNWENLYTGIVGGGRKRSLLRFDLSFLPAGAVIDSATFSIYQNGGGQSAQASGPSGVRTVGVYRITANWTETGVTWNNFGGYDPATVNGFSPAGLGWKSAGVTDLVRGWVTGAYPNYGLLLDDPTTTPDENETYDASEYGTISRRPKLSICYHTGDASTATPTPTATVSKTPSPTVTPKTPTPTKTPSPTKTPTVTRSATPTRTPTATAVTIPSTFYIRPDGGSADQCTGLADAPYSGNGTQQPCAWQHPFYALPPGGQPRIAGGDTLIIRPGSYMLGYGAPGADACDSSYPWDCTMPPIPGGPDAQHPTRLLGGAAAAASAIRAPEAQIGYVPSCASPPELWGAERAYQLLNLTGADNIEIGCLELTDHSSCVEFHSGGLACERDSYPFGPWAATGIHAEDSANVHLHDLNIHGLASGGVHAGRLTNWQVENVRIAGNGWSGWDGDIEGDDGNTGTLAFYRWTVEWNGCAETWPGGHPTGCWAQTAGGYGDGVGTGETGGRWIIENSVFRHNTSDGLDLLYVRRPGSSIEIRRTHAEGNAGNQIKTTGSALVENSIIVGNCGFFDGQAFTYDVDNCRALGNALSLSLNPGNTVQVINNTLTGEGDCLMIAECTGGCTGAERVRARNNLFLGQIDFQQPFEQSCLVYQESFPADPFDVDYSVIQGVKDDACPGAHATCGAPVGVTQPAIDAFDAHLLSSSPAINAGTTENAPVKDYDGQPRDTQPDIGAYEYRGPVPGTATPTATATRTPTSTPSRTPTATRTATPTPTATATAEPTHTATWTPLIPPSLTPTATRTLTKTVTPINPTQTVTPSSTSTPSRTPTVTIGISSISGRVLDSNGHPVAGVTITAGAGRTAVTDGRGIYMLASVMPGAYTLVPAKSGYSFTPASRQVSVPPTATHQDFAGNPGCGSDTTPVDVLLVLDRSESMVGRRLADLQVAAKGFVERLNLAQDQIGVVSFADTSTLDARLTQDEAALKAALEALSAGGGANMSAAINTAQAELSGARHNPAARPAMIFMADGPPTVDTAAAALAAAQAAKNAGTRLFTVGLGSVDVNLLRQLASTPTDFFYAPNSADLAAIYQSLAGQAHCPQTKIKVQPASKRQSLGAGVFTLDIIGQDVIALGAYQAELNYDPAVVHVTAVTPGPFLGSTGRIVSSVGPIIDNATGRVVFGAFTLGAQPGVSGTGLLATITFEPQGPGVSALQWRNLRAATPDGAAIGITAEDGQVEISACFGDFDDDGDVDIFDLQALAQHWNCRRGDACYDSRFDAEPDGDIDVFDLQRFGAAWGGSCGIMHAPAAASAQGPAAVSLQLLPSNSTIGVGESFTLTAVMTDAANVGAFQTDVAYDPAILRVEQVTIGPFLGSTGRAVTPVGPSVDAILGKVTFGAFTIGSQPGVSDQGELAYIVFRAQAPGEADVTFQQTSVSDTTGNVQFLGILGESRVTVTQSVKVYLPLVIR